GTKTTTLADPGTVGYGKTPQPVAVRRRCEVDADPRTDEHASRRVASEHAQSACAEQRMPGPARVELERRPDLAGTREQRGAGGAAATADDLVEPRDRLASADQHGGRPPRGLSRDVEHVVDAVAEVDVGPTGWA